jgi:hypothetical protein
MPKPVATRQKQKTPPAKNKKSPSKSKAKRPHPALLAAMEKYGWAMPLSIWAERDLRARDRAAIRPLYSITVSELLRRFPISRDLIGDFIIQAASDAYGHYPSGPRDPRSVMEKLSALGVVFACVPKGSRKGVVTLGTTAPSDLKSAREFCSSATNGAQLIGSLIATASQTPVVSLSAGGQALFEQYYQECKERQRGGSKSVAEGDQTPSDKDAKKRVIDAEKKAAEAKAEADKARKDAEQAKKDADAARQAEQQAIAQANTTNADPQATPQQKADATQAADRATVDRQQAEDREADANDNAAAADQAYRDASKAAVDAQKDYDLHTAVADATNDYLNHLKDMGWFWVITEEGTALAALGATTLWASRIAGAYSGRYEKECMEGECGYGNCESEARSKALLAEARSYKTPRLTCNRTARPGPNDERCYDKPGGLFDVPEVTLVEAIKLACRIRQKVSNEECRDMLPQQIFKAAFRRDPCKSPNAMCAPEDSRPPHGVSSNPSIPLPKGFHGSDPTMWLNPSGPRSRADRAVSRGSPAG